MGATLQSFQDNDNAFAATNHSNLPTLGVSNRYNSLIAKLVHYKSILLTENKKQIGAIGNQPTEVFINVYIKKLLEQLKTMRRSSFTFDFHRQIQNMKAL